MQLLGSLIFAYWRHFEHWSHNLEEIYSERKWFVATLTKLKELAEEQVKVKEQNDKIVFKYYTGGYGPSNEQFEEHLIITPDFIIYKKKRNSHKPYGYDDSDISLTLSKGPYGFNDCFLRVSSYLDIIKSFIPTIEIFDASCLKISVNKINGTRFKYDLYPSECEKELIDIRNMILPYFDELLFPEFLRPSVDDDCEDDDEYDGGNK